jgi:hypothetical protein
MTAATIALLNDLARTTLRGCRLVITQGIAALDELEAVIGRVQAFNAFNASNDPYGEHDFGAIEHVAGNGLSQTLFWKFDYYDLDLCMASPDPTDATVTTRVLTIMLAEEY